MKYVYTLDENLYLQVFNHNQSEYTVKILVMIHSILLTIKSSKRIKVKFIIS